MNELSRSDQLRLLKFVCTFAWTDLVVTDEERALVERIAERAGLPPADGARVQTWLRVPPRPEEVDPTEIPREHRQVFLDAARAVVVADKRVSPSERDCLKLFEELIHYGSSA